jgi:hypothetical protein
MFGFLSLNSLSSPSFCIREVALKLSLDSGCFVGGFCPPKKLVRVKDLRGSGLMAEFGRGLEFALGLPPGWKEGAAALGLNSLARTLNLVDAFEFGV